LFQKLKPKKFFRLHKRTGFFWHIFFTDWERTRRGLCTFILDKFSDPFFVFEVFIEIIKLHGNIFNWNEFMPSFYNNLSNKQNMLTHPKIWKFLGYLINKNLIIQQPIDQTILIAAYRSDFKKKTFFWCLDCIFEKGFISNPLELISLFIIDYEFMPKLDFLSLPTYAIFMLKSLKFLNDKNQLISVLTNGTSEISKINLPFIRRFCHFLSMDNLEVITNTIDIIKILHLKNREILKLCTQYIEESFDSDNYYYKGYLDNLETILKTL